MGFKEILKIRHLSQPGETVQSRYRKQNSQTPGAREPPQLREGVHTELGTNQSRWTHVIAVARKLWVDVCVHTETRAPTLTLVSRDSTEMDGPSDCPNKNLEPARSGSRRNTENYTWVSAVSKDANQIWKTEL